MVQADKMARVSTRYNIMKKRAAAQVAAFEKYAAVLLIQSNLEATACPAPPPRSNQVSSPSSPPQKSPLGVDHSRPLYQQPCHHQISGSKVCCPMFPSSQPPPSARSCRLLRAIPLKTPSPALPTPPTVPAERDRPLRRRRGR